MAKEPFDTLTPTTASKYEGSRRETGAGLRGRCLEQEVAAEYAKLANLARWETERTLGSEAAETMRPRGPLRAISGAGPRP
jgi:hypothetical protein